jgi:hypothetical protein
LLGLQERDGNVVNRNAAGGFPGQGAMVGVPMNDQIGAMAVNDLGKARGAEVRENFGGFALHRGSDR